MLELFSLKGKTAVITGGAGLLGRQYAAAILEAGGLPVLWDVQGETLAATVRALSEKYGQDVMGERVDITDPVDVQAAVQRLASRGVAVDILINNAANNPRVEAAADREWSRFEHFPLKAWNDDLAVGLTGAFLCSQALGQGMARRGSGVILNISSDRGIIGPDQRLYMKEGLPPDQQPVKPVTYSAVKHALIGLTRYLATYWADRGVRANALCPGGVFAGQPEVFVQRLSHLIPMGRMAAEDEYKAAVLFLVSDASRYMTGSVVVMDGGRTCW